LKTEGAYHGDTSGALTTAFTDALKSIYGVGDN
jgi:hypothetical protein